MITYSYMYNICITWFLDIRISTCYHMYVSAYIEQAYFNNYLLEEQECLYNLYKVKEKGLQYRTHYKKGKYKLILYSTYVI